MCSGTYLPITFFYAQPGQSVAEVSAHVHASGLRFAFTQDIH